MDTFLLICSLVTYVERRVGRDICYTEMEKTMGFSYRHIREVFRECTNIPLSRYISSRKMANAAFDIAHTGQTLTYIAGKYGFDAYDTFTRAFRRETGLIPSIFRKAAIPVGRKKLAMGAYGPAILPVKHDMLIKRNAEVDHLPTNIEKTQESCILFGVPKVAYSDEECTPFPACLKSCLHYMGQQVDYAALMAASGAAFRLRWNMGMWDGGNVDIRIVYENDQEAFLKSFQAAGRRVRMLERTHSNKAEFQKFIVEEIDAGRPVIALGIIGPPEACILTGYMENGETLLGWNFFQDNPEFAADVQMHETGYFICKKWWENEQTSLLMAIGEEEEAHVPLKEQLQNAVEILEKEQLVIRSPDGEKVRIYAGGQAAYDAWANAIGNEREFPAHALLPLLFERIMCQTDAQVMVGEGRSYAAVWLNHIGDSLPQQKVMLSQAAEEFKKAACSVFRMYALRGGFEQTESAAKTFAKPEVRKKVIELIYEAKEHEAKAKSILKEIVEQR